MKAREFKIGENLDVIHAPLIGSYMCNSYAWWRWTTVLRNDVNDEMKIEEQMKKRRLAASTFSTLSSLPNQQIHDILIVFPLKLNFH